MADKLFKVLWFVAAWHNFIGGALFLIFSNQVYTRSDLNPPEPGIHYQTWIGLIFVFGLTYYMVYRDMYANRNLVFISILGKFVSAFPMLGSMILISDQIPKLFIIPIVTDFVFGLLFIAFFLFAMRNQKWSGQPTL